MIVNMKSVLFVLALLPTFSLALNLIQCNNGARLPNSVTVSGCSHTPCDLQIGTSILVNTAFTAVNGGSEYIAKVFAESLGMTGEYELPEDQANVCGRLVGSSCPLDPNEDATYLMEMPVDEVYPITTMVLEIQIEEDGVPISCFRVPAQTVPA